MIDDTHKEADTNHTQGKENRMMTLTVKIDFDEQTQTATKEFVGSPSPSKTAAELTEGNGLVVELGSGWPKDSYISRVRVGHIDGGISTTIANWTPPDPGIVKKADQTECFEITPNAPTSEGPNNTPNPTPTTVFLQDIESLRNGSDPFLYEVWVETDNGNFEADPEVINKSGNDDPEWGEPVLVG